MMWSRSAATAFDYNAEHAARVLVGDPVKRLLCESILLAACGGASRTNEVSLSLPTPSQTAAPPPATLLGCTIVGTGERRREGEEPFPFRVYESDSAHEPVFVIDRPQVAHVTWSHFPERAGRGLSLRVVPPVPSAHRPYRPGALQAQS